MLVELDTNSNNYVHKSNGLEVRLFVKNKHRSTFLNVIKNDGLLINIVLIPFDHKYYNKIINEFKAFLAMMEERYGSLVDAINHIIESGVFDKLSVCNRNSANIYDDYYNVMFNNMLIIIDYFSFNRTKSARN